MKCPRCKTSALMNDQRWCHVCGSEMKENRFAKIIKALLRCLFYYLVFYVISDAIQWFYVGYCAALTEANGFSVVVGGNYSEAFWAIFSKSYSYVMILTYAVIFLAFTLWFALRRKDPLREMGIRPIRPSHVPGLAVFGLSVQALTSITIAIFSVFMGPIGEQTQQSYDNMFGSETTLAMYIFMAVATPMIEEIIFRGLIHKNMREVMPRGAAVILSSLCFGLCHGEFYRVVYATLLGILLAAVCEKYGSILPSVIIHTAFNTMSFVYEVLPENPLVYICIYFIAMGVSIACAVCFFASTAHSERKNTNETL